MDREVNSLILAEALNLHESGASEAALLKLDCLDLSDVGNVATRYIYRSHFFLTGLQSPSMAITEARLAACLRPRSHLAHLMMYQAIKSRDRLLAARCISRFFRRAGGRCGSCETPVAGLLATCTGLRIRWLAGEVRMVGSIVLSDRAGLLHARDVEVRWPGLLACSGLVIDQESHVDQWSSCDVVATEEERSMSPWTMSRYRGDPVVIRASSVFLRVLRPGDPVS
jgi:hypothetical protein